MLEPRKKSTFLEIITKPIIYKFLKDFNSNRKTEYKQQFLARDSK